MNKSVAAYGSWLSQLTAQALSVKGCRYGHMVSDQGNLYWLEVRSKDKGRGVIVCYTADGKKYDVLPDDISVRTRVHEYGGADFNVFAGKIYFSNAEDNRVYSFDGGLTPVTPQTLTPLTPLEAGKQFRYADFCLDTNGNKLIAIRETHEDSQVINQLVSICLLDRQVKVLHSGFDFYASPGFSHLGSRLCWLCWNQPQMPWTAAELWLADYHADDGSIDAAHRVTGGVSNAIFQPQWSQDDQLHYISDRSGWSNIYRHLDGILHALTPTNREFGLPQWLLGMSTYVINADDSLYAVFYEQGQQKLCHLDPSTGHIEPIALPFKCFENALLADENHIYFCASAPTIEAAIYRYDIKQQTYEKLTENKKFSLPPEDISLPQAISCQSAKQRTCYAFYYPPKNNQYQAPDGELPPLIVLSHGGPTAHSSNSLDANVQFWTHRGFAVVDVNYVGSTGYGRAYRDALNGQWGIADVEDCIAVAKHLVKQKLADEKRLLIRGGSAGGYTTLCALTFHDVFAAGTSRYGVADLEALAAESHKFEARYLDLVVGPYPEKKTVYQQRSPVNHTDKLSCPILLLQGEDDKVVPPSQAEVMVKALKAKKIPYAYLLFADEGHGFRQAETIVKAYQAELSFYRQVLKIDSEEEIEKLQINYL